MSDDAEVTSPEFYEAMRQGLAKRLGSTEEADKKLHSLRRAASNALDPVTGTLYNPFTGREEIPPAWVGSHPEWFVFPYELDGVPKCLRCAARVERDDVVLHTAFHVQVDAGSAS